MHDPQYRMAIAWQNGAYNQPPHPGFYLGTDMNAPPTSNIVMVGAPVSGSSITIQENTNGFCSVDGTVDSNNAGYTGTGFANGNNAANAGVSWRITTPAAGSYTLNWRYANGGGSDRPSRLLVNSSTSIASISFPATANWTTWANVSVNVSLPAGTVNLRIEGTTASGPANIDNLVIAGNNPVAVACTSGRMAMTDIQTTEEKINIAVYPNPASKVFRLTAPGAFSYEAYDATGRLVEKGKAQNKVQVGLQWSAGWYLVKIKSGTETITKKVMKQ
jgi:hypothetical protein